MVVTQSSSNSMDIYTQSKLEASYVFIGLANETRDGLSVRD